MTRGFYSATRNDSDFVTVCGGQHSLVLIKSSASVFSRVSTAVVVLKICVQMTLFYRYTSTCTRWRGRADLFISFVLHASLIKRSIVSRSVLTRGFFMSTARRGQQLHAHIIKLLILSNSNAFCFPPHCFLRPSFPIPPPSPPPQSSRISLETTWTSSVTWKT